MIALRKALTEMQALAPQERGVVRLRLLCSANDFVADCAATLLRLHDLGHREVTLAQVTARIADKYGHRGMVPQRVRYVLQTLRQCGGVAHERQRWRALPVLAAACGGQG